MSRPSLIGQVIGERYRIDEILGRGGMSEVYKAYDPNLRRVVAIKIIHSHLADDPRFRSRFEEEAAAVAQLRHPNIVQVFDFNHSGDLYYMVQEFISGETLQERLRFLSRSGRRMPVPEAIGYVLNICDAAGYAHRRGMIHRDIKPANIMLDVNGQAILMDFGIVKIAGAEHHTAAGAVIGTALYMPPELIRSEVPDARSDLYSLGVVLFEAVSGRPPFEADSAMSLMMMHLKDQPPDLHQLRPGVSEDLITVIEKCLAKDREARYASMADLSTALKRVLDRIQAGTPIQPTETEEPLDGTVISPSSSFTPGKSAERGLNRPSTSSTGGGGPSRTGPAPALPMDGFPAGQGPRKMIWFGGLALVGLVVLGVLIVILLGALLVAPRLLTNRGAGQPTSLAALPSPTGLSVVVPASTRTARPTLTATSSGSGAETTVQITVTPLSQEPTKSPAPSLSPTPTIPAGVPYAVIRGITTDDQGRYIVDYETFGYKEKVPGVHVHFFFNTVKPEKAGMPAQGSWILYGGPRPFMGYRQSDRPENATHLCILVANPDHSIQTKSGNCFILPDIVVATAIQDSACLEGPDPVFPEVAQLPANQSVVVKGISPDEGWWNTINPQKPDDSCWLPVTAVLISGDISQLPLVEPPPRPAGAAIPAISVEITGITLDDQNRYVVSYITREFTESLPGTHLHFFFDTVSPEQVGITGGGLRLMFGGPSPFTGYTLSDRPEGANKICVLVANPDHSVIFNSGNCFQLPEP